VVRSRAIGVLLNQGNVPVISDLRNSDRETGEMTVRAGLANRIGVLVQTGTEKNAKTSGSEWLRRRFP
jgi:hypothetical protein